MFSTILSAQRQVKPEWQGERTSFQALGGTKAYQLGRKVDEIALSGDPDKQKILKTASLVEDFFGHVVPAEHEKEAVRLISKLATGDTKTLEKYSLERVISGRDLPLTIQDTIGRKLGDKLFNVVVIHQVVEQMNAGIFHREIPGDYLTIIQGMTAEMGVVYPTGNYYPLVLSGPTTYTAEVEQEASAPALVQAVAPPIDFEAAARQAEAEIQAGAEELRQEEERIGQLRIEADRSKAEIVRAEALRQQEARKVELAAERERLEAEVKAAQAAAARAAVPAAPAAPVSESLDPQIRELMGDNYIGPQEWESFFGESLSEVPAYPADIVATLQSACPFKRGRLFKRGQTVAQTHILFILPSQVKGQALSILKWREIMNNKEHRSPHKDGKFCSKPGEGWYDKKPFAKKSLSRAEWVLMPKEMVPHSTRKTYAEQEQEIAKYRGYKRIDSLRQVSGIMLYNLRTGTKLYGEDYRVNGSLPYVKCEDAVSGGYRVSFGHFGAGGFGATYYDDAYRRGDVGAAVLRE